MTDYSRKALVADIGGTNIRFAISDIDELTISDFASLRAADFDGPKEALERYLKTIPGCPSMIGVAIAGQVSEQGAKMTKLPWSFSRNDIRAVTGAEHVCFVNDLEAVALALPHLSDYDVHQIGEGAAAPNAAKAVIGAGTGLGVAGLVWSPNGWVPIAGEGGNVSFGARDQAELELIEPMQSDLGYTAAESLLSGAGLVAMYQVLAGQKGKRAELAKASDVVKLALADHDPTAEAALRQFASWLGRFAGDVALLYGARGGVYLGGGIAPEILDTINAGGFRAAFNAKGRLTSYASSIPVYVIKAGADAGLRGAAVALSRTLPIT